MSASFTCDGCKANIDQPTVIGLVTKRDYCPDCAQKANIYLDTLEFLRKASFDKFHEDRSALIARFGEGGFLLPDVANVSN